MKWTAAAALMLLAAGRDARAECGAAEGPRVGLVLSGGGARGLAHVGVLEALEAEGIGVDRVAGTSMGAAIGGLWAAGHSAADIERARALHRLAGGLQRPARARAGPALAADRRRDPRVAPPPRRPAPPAAPGPRLRLPAEPPPLPDARRPRPRRRRRLRPAPAALPRRDHRPRDRAAGRARAGQPPPRRAREHVAAGDDPHLRDRRPRAGGRGHRGQRARGRRPRDGGDGGDRGGRHLAAAPARAMGRHRGRGTAADRRADARTTRSSGRRGPIS